MSITGMAADITELEATRPEFSLVFGGARSGKSALAERLVLARDQNPVYVATAPLDTAQTDSEMHERIRLHQARRASVNWTTVEAGVNLVPVLRSLSPNPDQPVLIDCLVLWLGTVMMTAFDECPEQSESQRAAYAAQKAYDALAELEGAIRHMKAPLVLVSGEAGMGVVPPSPLGRVWRDVLGRANQTLASIADQVILCVAGLPLVLKNKA